MNFAIAVALLLLLGLLTLVSYVDRLYTEIGKFLSREFQDNINAFEQRIDPKLHATRPRPPLSLPPLPHPLTPPLAMLLPPAVFRARLSPASHLLHPALRF